MHPVAPFGGPHPASGVMMPTAALSREATPTKPAGERLKELTERRLDDRDQPWRETSAASHDRLAPRFVLTFRWKRTFRWCFTFIPH